MKKLAPWFLSFIFIIIIGFFSFNIFLKIYFNQNYYSLPQLVGLTLDESKDIKLIDNINLIAVGEEFSELPVGVISRQSPEASKVVKKGRNISIWISKGENTYIMPNFLNKNVLEIAPELQANGIRIKKISYINSRLPYNTIIATNPSAGNKTTSKKEISVLVSNSKSARTILVPDTIGFTFKEASANLASRGLTIGAITEIEVEGLESGIVIESTNIGENVPVGTTIDFKISK